MLSAVVTGGVVLLFEQLAVPFISLQGAACFDVATLRVEAEGTIRHLSTLHTKVRVLSESVGKRGCKVREMGREKKETRAN